jgi:hypothetical protein
VPPRHLTNTITALDPNYNVSEQDPTFITPSDTVYSDYPEENKSLETIKSEDLIERQRTLAKRHFYRHMLARAGDDIDGAKPLLANRSSMMNKVLGVVWKDELEEKRFEDGQKSGRACEKLGERCAEPMASLEV